MNTNPQNSEQSKKSKNKHANAAAQMSESSSLNEMQQSLSMVNTAIIMTDSDNNIMFANAAATDLFHRYESGLQALLGRFSPESVVGMNMSSIPQTTGKNDNSATVLSDTYRSQVELDDTTLTLLSTPILDGGEHTGTLIEWHEASDDSELEDLESMFSALDKVQAIIQFEPDGTIITANDNFLAATGYSLDEIKGQHHRMFVDELTKSSPIYTEFWNSLAAGESMVSEFKRINKAGEEFWINASYNPIFDQKGKVYKVVKFATDVTKQKREYAEFQGKMEAISKAQAVIEFNLDGTIISANENFLATTGYRLDEIQGNHHSIFVSDEYKESQDYKEFWHKLNQGEYFTGDFQRFGKGGNEIWIKASYNPILDMNGNVVKVVKYASDITEERKQAIQNSRIKQALDKAGANVIVTGPEFTIDYMNNSMVDMFKTAESQLRQDLPNFDANDLYGKPMDVFHKNPVYQRQLMDNLKEPHTADVVVGGINFRIVTTPIIDASGDKIGTIMEWEDRTEAIRQEEEAVENARIRQALDKAGSNVIVSGPGNTIDYLNDSIKTMFASAESSLRQDLPHFSARDLIGKSMDEFHKNPSYQKNLVENLTQPHTANVSIAGIIFKITTTPIISEEGERLGTIMEWVDRTQELAVEDEVGSIVDQALSGNLTERICLDGKKDFFLKLSEGINNLMEINQQVVEDTIEMLSAMADGNLSQRITSEYQGSFDKLKDDANTTVENLIKVIANIKSGSSNVKSASSEIAEGNLNLSQRTEQQAASLEETASSMEEMTATIMQNTESAHNANKLASKTAEIAETGGQVVSEAINAMGTISESSNKIADIISVIDEIAFQTNLLALNASVEAARAGEQGRGFAVVAGEVRNLAGRSATAAKEIKELIEDSGKKVEEGKQLVNRSGESLTNIVSSVREVSDLVAEIAAASEEQSQGITEVNKAVARMDEMTQQNAALVEEVASSSDAMGNLAVQLEDVVSFFKIDDEQVMNSDIARNISQQQPQQRSTVTMKSKPMSSHSSSKSDSDSWEEF